MTTVQNTALATGRWWLVASLTTASFTARGLGGRPVTGTVPVTDAWVDVDAAGTPLLVRATLDLTGIATGNRRRDADLRKPHLLDTAGHPVLTFTGTPRETADGWEIAGRLTARTAADVLLHAGITRHGADGELAVSATTTVDRRALGVKAPRPLIGRPVRISVQAVFRPPR